VTSRQGNVRQFVQAFNLRKGAVEVNDVIGLFERVGKHLRKNYELK
jgi:hypothetical protein